MKQWFVFVLLCFAALPVVAADREDVAPDHVFTAILTAFRKKSPTSRNVKGIAL